MMIDSDQRLLALWKEVDLPERAYELALKRYKDLGEWLSRGDSTLAGYDPHVFVQGSFALGTPIRQVVEGEEYDLDFTCKLRSGVRRETHTQKQLKALVGDELLSYRDARNIQKPMVEKTRCWRLGYKDELPFHMDVVPGIRADDARRRVLTEAMEKAGTPVELAQEVARRALWITDMQSSNYDRISNNWPSSNPGGYQLWFHSRMRSSDTKRFLAEAQVDPVPVYRSKMPLQQIVQLLKRHRDVMFKDVPKSKPASIIITTVAGAAYIAGESISLSMQRVMASFESVRASNTDVIANPVNPAENFADRWARPDNVRLQLKANFHRWVDQANRDFNQILGEAGSRLLTENVEDALGLTLSESIRKQFGMISGTPASVRNVQLHGEPARPWAAR
jgi:hypothetical protein